MSKIHFNAQCLLAASISLLFALPSWSAPLNKAREFVKKLYSAYERNESPYYAGDSASQIYSPSLVALIRAGQTQAGGEIGALDRDPLCGCQGFTLSNLQIGGYMEGSGRKESFAGWAYTAAC